MPKELPIKNAIRRLRFDADEMTQHALAEKVGVTRQTILAIEAARYSPTLELAFRIVEVFGKPLRLSQPWIGVSRSELGSMVFIILYI